MSATSTAGPVGRLSRIGLLLAVAGLAAWPAIGAGASPATTRAAAVSVAGSAAAPVVVGWNGPTSGRGGGFGAPSFSGVVGGEVDYVNNGPATLTLSITGSTVQTTTIPPGGRAEQPLRSVGSYVLAGSDIAGAPPGTVARVGERARAVLAVSPRGATGGASATPTVAPSTPAPGGVTSSRPAPRPAGSPAGVSPTQPAPAAAVHAVGTGLPAMHVRARGFGLPVAAAVVFLLAVLGAIVRVLLAVPDPRRH